MLGILIGFQGAFGGQLLDPIKLFAPERDEREEQLTGLKDEFAKLQESTQEQLKTIQDNLEQVNREINTTKDQLQAAPTPKQEFLNKKISLSNEIYQILFNIQFTHKEIISTVEQQIKLLEEYRKDPSYKGLILEPRSFYSYDAVQNAIKRVFDQEDKIRGLTTQKKDAEVELENRKKKFEAANKSYQEKKKEQQEFVTKEEGQSPAEQLDFKQRGELLDLQEKFEAYQRKLAKLRVEASTRKIAFINTNIFTENEKFDVLKNNLAWAKSGLRIAEAEVQEVREKLEKEKQKSLAVKETHFDEIKRLTAIREKLRQEIEAISKRYNVSVLDKEEFATWSIETPTIESYSALCEMGYKNSQIQLLDRRIEYLRSEIQLEDANFRREEIKVIALSTWFDLSQRKIKDGEEILQELKRFRELEAEINRELNSFKDRQNAATNVLNFQNKELNNLRNFIQEVQQEKDTIFRRYPLRYNACLVRLAEAEKIIGEQIDTIGKLLEVYSSAISSLNGTIKELNIILTELETKSIWQRSQYAVSWQGIRNIIPDLGYFLRDLRQITTSYVSTITWRSVMNTVLKFLRTPARLIFSLFFLCFTIAFYYVLKLRLPALRHYLLKVSSNNRFIEVVSKILGCFVGFLEKHLVGTYLWIVLGIALYIELIPPDLFPRILFCLLSIPYLIYYARTLIRFFVACNRQYEFPIFAELFEKRFVLVVSIFFYLTIFVLFFREVFMLTTIHKSELPNILLAAYSIILRTLIIFSIGKDEILALITKRGPFWTWIARIIEDYYYLILITIIFLMIMSDPYVGGYSNLVSYIIWGLIGTAILVRVLYLIHTYFKKYSENIFFSTDDEVKRERFSYAKTWYGIFVIALFVIFIVLALAIGTKIWNIPIVFEDIYKVLHFNLFSTGVEKGEMIWFTPYKFLVLVSFIIVGFLSAVAFDRFVLQRIFDILPVDLGIQNTVMSITRYLIIFIAIYLGFQWAGLGNLLIAIGTAVVLISYILKEPVADFISYFIILVQRPIQIGDYIMISEDVQGVVRKITPRSVILRRKDSYSIIVPNYTILTQVINNWSYARNFVAFEDIYLTIAYTADPIQVKNIIQKVLDESSDVLKSPRPIIRLHEFGEYGLVFLVRGFISNINILRRWEIASNIRLSILAALREHNIKVAVPTRLILRNDYPGPE